jgi:hypothetical protein
VQKAPGPDAAWPEFERALSLTSSQRTQLAAELVAAAAGASYHTEYGDVRAELVPQLCLLLYRSSYQDSDGLGSTVQWMKAQHAVSAFARCLLLSTAVS